MNQWKLYHNPNCSKSREALTLLETTGVNFHIINYIKNPLTQEELTGLISELNCSLSSLVRTKEHDFTEAPFDVNSAEEVAYRLSKEPHLMERPILQGKGVAVIGRPLENFKVLLDNN
ncbi:ArsC/Spx/MgsR family protein [Bdellovibrio reynosensis]|uniref:Arsenate reductase family protein n=1 Tax=Bdellovibrio reynosensis TaxID=2835041 RepID=A0ABY4C5K5_9BACT|nr:ArsC/Spx/MgsR family protein [Bdellovibrio reynosensis]UOF00109.1 arsenate reductase family protein [Bdellovibrio reynosensis]